MDLINLLINVLLYTKWKVISAVTYIRDIYKYVFNLPGPKQTNHKMCVNNILLI